MTHGTVVAVSLSAGGGVPKYPQPEVVITVEGIVGDHHSGATRFSKAQRRVVPNERQVSVVAVEALERLNARLGISLKEGDLAENLLVSGLGDLSDLVAGDVLHVESGATRATLRVTEQNVPCKLLLPHHEGMIKACLEVAEDGTRVNRRGVVCGVVAVDGDGRLFRGARVILERAGEVSGGAGA